MSGGADGTGRASPAHPADRERPSTAVEGDERLDYSSLTAVGKAIREGTITPSALVERQLLRAERVGSALNCFVTVTPEAALERAAELDRKASEGDYLGPLHGVPVTIKDNVGCAGVRTTAASRVLADWVPSADSPAVQRLKSAGAVILGKTNLSEFAFGSTHPDFGDVLNPWDRSLSTGGSSSGSAAALAAGIGYASIGTDTGGSIRIPSSLCGLVGLKPTFGLVESAGIVPISLELDHVGPMARTVEDVAMVLDVIARSDWSGRAGLAKMDESGLRGLRLGVLPDHELEGVHPDALVGMKQAREALVALGCEPRPVTIPDRAAARSAMWTLAAVELLVDQEQNMTRLDDFGEGMRAALDRASKTDASTYLKARRTREDLRAALDLTFEEVDLLLTPAVPVVAHPFEQRPALRDARQAYTTLFNLTGNPALVLPVVISRENLPLGVQLIGRRFSDDLVLRAGLAIERSLGSIWNRQDVLARLKASISAILA